MKSKEIEQIFSPPPTRWVGNGFKVHNFFPYLMPQQRMSPFFLLDYNAKMVFPPSNIPQGVGVHPHRGIETVTVAYRGKVAHKDSAGNGGVISEGDLQWMTAGKGVLHREYHEDKFNQLGGEFQMAQIWVNLPQKYKMTMPKYQALLYEELPKYYLDDGMGNVDIIAGNFKGIKGIASTFSPIELYNIHLKQKGKLSFDLQANYNTGILLVAGNASVNGKKIPENHFVLFKNEGEKIDLEAKSDSIILTLSGAPLHEPIAAGGPFVMNTHEELEQAFSDYENGEFGHLDDWAEGL